MRSTTLIRGFTGGIVLVTFIIIGCSRSNGPELGQVTGTVMRGNEPVPYAFVRFQPIDPPGTYGAAYADENGRYVLQFSRSRAGAPVGRHLVSIRPSQGDELRKSNPAAGESGSLPVPDWYRKLKEFSVEREVKAGNNTHDFDFLKPE